MRSEHGVGDRRRHRSAARRAGGEQLLDEERVAAGAGVQLAGERGRHRRAGDRLELAGDVVAVERLEIEPRDERPARQLRRRAAAAGAGRELAGAVGERERDALGAQVAREEREEVARRAVGPVHVLEHDQQRRVLLGRRPSRLSTSSYSRPWPKRPRSAARAGPRRGRRGSRAASALARVLVEVRRRVAASTRRAGRAARRRSARRRTPRRRTRCSRRAARGSPRSRARVLERAAASRVLPTPASPAISASRGRPAAASASAPSRTRSGSSRPISSSLVTRAPTGSPVGDTTHRSGFP